MEETRLNKQQICNWFANYRRKLKKAASQQESVGELNQSPGSPQHSMRSPQITVGGSGRPPVSGNSATLTFAMNVFSLPVHSPLPAFSRFISH